MPAPTLRTARPAIAVPPADPGAPRNAVDRAAEGIVALIERGRLVGGSALGEVDLAERLQVARSTVREALGRLESRGLATRARGRGLAVRRLDRKDVVDLYVLREQLEGLAARLAAERQRDERPLARARIAAERQRWRELVRGQALPAFSDANRAFHDLVIEASGNRHLPDMLDRTLMLLFASQFRTRISAPDTIRAAQHHLDVLAAIEVGDGPGAERAMRLHVRESAKALLALDDDAFD